MLFSFTVLFFRLKLSSISQKADWPKSSVTSRGYLPLDISVCNLEVFFVLFAYNNQAQWTHFTMIRRCEPSQHQLIWHSGFNRQIYRHYRLTRHPSPLLPLKADWDRGIYCPMVSHEHLPSSQSIAAINWPSLSFWAYEKLAILRNKGIIGRNGNQAGWGWSTGSDWSGLGIWGDGLGDSVESAAGLHVSSILRIIGTGMASHSGLLDIAPTTRTVVPA